MLRRLVDLSLSARLAVLGLALALAGIGGWSFLNLPVDAFPDISSTQVKIILKAPGMTPEEVESRVITPIEMEMLGIPKQQILRSIAKYGIADITIDFQDGTDVYWARSQVNERLTGIMEDMPPSVEGGMAPIATPLTDVYMFTLEGPQSLAEKRRVLDWTIRPALRTVPGVADVNSLGGRAETFEVRPDPNLMAVAGLTYDDIATAIGAGNRNDGAGRLSVGDEALIVRAVGAIKTEDDLRSVVVKAQKDGVLRLSDVATVGTGSLTRYGAVTRNGTGEAVQGIVIALKGSDASKVVREVKVRAAEIQRSLPKGMTINVFYDRSELVGRAVGTVEEALLEATILVVILLLLFLGDIRASLIVAAALPMATLVTFILMKQFGMSANLMSLGGLAIAIGMLVDGAVVVIENVVERLSDPGHAHSSKLNRVLVATSEVVVPVASGLLIIALVFLPLLTLEGLEGKLFGPVAMTIVLALASSLVLALTLVPVLASYGLKGDGDHKEPWLMRQLSPRYHRLLDWAFVRKTVVYSSAGAALLVAVAAYSFVGKTFLPTMDEGAVLLQIEKHPSISLQHSIEGDLRVQKLLMAKVPEILEIVGRVGSDELGLDPMSLNDTDTFLRLKPRSEWRVQDKDWLIEQIRQAMEELPGFEHAFTQPIEMRVSEMLTGSRGDLAIKLFGPDLKVLGELAARIDGRLRKIRGATEVITVADDSVEYLQLDIDRLAAGRAGMPVQNLQDALRAQVEGVRAGVVAEGNRRVPIVIRGDPALASDPTLFTDQTIVSPSGMSVRVSDVARVTRTEGPVKLEHENGSRFALIQAFVSGRDLVGFVDEAKADLAKNVPLPSGYRLEWGGQFENQQRASARLTVVLPIALILIFIVLYVTLRSVRASLLIIANIPFAVVGGIVALLVTGEYLSVPASVGFIALLGIAVLNGLVMVSYFRQLRESGLSMAEAVRRGAERRLRPVLMTATITGFGLVPLLFATGPGSEIQRPLAIVVIGGLITSTLLTLVLLPMLYERFGESRAEREAQADNEGYPA
ncbi:MAG: CusA/CzcA family heavy metal efflux RND transporter [Pseudomonadota bacterium]|nr:CusA/CzcA family heavy metal efflux RND transporter [Pseudomonadota bacterium]